MTPKSIEQLVNTDEPGMAVVREWASTAKNPIEFLEVDPEAGRRVLLALQVTSRSPMGAIALESGGVLIDDGWVRVLGSGHTRLPRALDTWNQLPTPTHRLPGTVLVGDDALGGFFALNGGGLPGPLGHVFYFAPDSLEWEDVADSYSDWLWFLMHGDLEKFYEGSRWPTWREDVRQLSGDRGFSIYPFLFAKGPPVEERSRGTVGIEELWGLHLGDLSPKRGR